MFSNIQESFCLAKQHFFETYSVIVFLISVPLPLFHYPILKSETSLGLGRPSPRKQKDHVKTNKMTQLLGFVQAPVLYEHLSSQIVTHTVNPLENIKIPYQPCYSIE